MTDTDFVLACLGLPLLGAVGVAAAGRVPNVREAITLLVSVLTATSAFQLAEGVATGLRPGLELLEVVPGLVLAFEVEPLGMLFALVASGLWVLTSIYAIGYMRGHHEENQTRFFICFALAISAALGVAFSRNLFTLFLFYELLTLSTYPLVTHHGTDAARRAGRIYLGVLMGTSIGLLLLAIVLTYQLSGTLEFTEGGILSGKASSTTAALLLGLYAFGTGKAALMPFHRWLPAAMVAPTPVSALLHAVAVVKAGVFSILKVVVYVFGLDFLTQTRASVWLMYAAAFTIIVGSLIAFTQDNLKARLAYSTISQLSYIVLGAALATPSAVTGGALHIAVHAVSKITLFFCAGAIMVGAHKTKVSELDGLGRAMPLTMGAFLIGAVSIAGLPPMGGSWSKWYLALGALDAEQAFFVGVLMVSSLLSLGYLVPVAARAFFLSPAKDSHVPAGLAEAPLLCVFPLCVTATGCLLLFFYSDAVVSILAPLAPLHR